MRDASAAFAGAVLGSHVALSRVEVWRDGEILVEDLPVEEGELTVDDTRAVPGEVTLRVPGREWDPVDPFDPLAPFGQRLHLSRGVRHPGADDELLPLGFYLITAATPDPLGGGVQVTARSLEQLLEDARWPKPNQPPAGSTYVGEFRRVVGNRLPVDDPPAGLADRALPNNRVWEDSRLDSLEDLATAWPARFRVDDTGLLVLMRPASQPATPALTLSTGSRGVIARWESSTRREDVYNAVYVTGEESTSESRVVTGVAWDDVETSPTRYGGPFGERPFLYSSSLLSTPAECRAAAATILAKRMRRTRTAEVELVPDPRIMVDDWIELDTPTVAGIGRVSALRLPLTPSGGPMVLTVEMGA